MVPDLLTFDTVMSHSERFVLTRNVRALMVATGWEAEQESFNDDQSEHIQKERLKLPKPIKTIYFYIPLALAWWVV